MYHFQQPHPSVDADELLEYLKGYDSVTIDVTNMSMKEYLWTTAILALISWDLLNISQDANYIHTTSKRDYVL